jgi:predicted AlkP superfamily phosphohydrolase/phosphomutase
LEEFDYTWRNFQQGLYFFYFSNLDQNSHALWSTFDKLSPIYNPEIEAKYGNVLRELYVEIDGVLGRILNEMRKDDLLIIMSDHGFAPFRYGFSLNTWLLENGYITLKDTSKRNEEFFTGVDWRKTKAYGLGINSLYLNLKGRESGGMVKSGKEAEELKDKLVRELTAVIDPKTGEHPISAVWKREQIYHGSMVEKAPDLIIGYNSGYRASWQTVLGKFHPEIITPNMDKWAGDHCVDYRLVPGVLLSNRKIKLENPVLYDLTPTILAEFDIPPPDNMVGKSIF